jgi:hypothetical protein
MNPGSVDPLPGVSLGDLLKQAGLYDQWIELQEERHGKTKQQKFNIWLNSIRMYTPFLRK